VCGIAGIAGRVPDPAALPGLVQAMTDAIAHRGPDAAGHCLDPHRHIALGHRRLSILDLSPSGAQPMTSRSGRWTLVLNGEIYNFRAIRDELERLGAKFRGTGDTEVLVEAIDCFGVDETLSRTNGMFSFAAWDEREHRLVLARDRLGEKPLYWMRRGGMLAFASELKALRTLPGVDLQIDPAAASALLRWSYIPHPRTIYRDVQQLAPGALLEVELGGSQMEVVQRSWWSLTDAVDRSLANRVEHADLGAAAEELQALLADAVSLRLQSDVPLGAFLSGGIDSSLVAALAADAMGERTLRTFTVTMPGSSVDESAPARAVARHLGTDHHEVHLSLASALDLVPRLAQVWDEPFADPSMLPTALLCTAARRELTVCLGGDGGDELFAGYNRHAVGAGLHQRAERLPALVRRSVGALAALPSPGVIDAASRLIPSARRPPNLGDKVHKAAALLRGGEDAWSAFAGVWPRSALPVDAIRPAAPAVLHSLDAVERMMLVDTASVLPDQMLVKVDRASMAVALEVRVPLLDHRLLEWSWRQPTAIRTSGGVGKVVLRRVAERVLPHDIVRRPKMGFDPPLGGWLRNELRPWAQDLLAAPRCVEAGWLEGSALRAAWSQHLAGRRNNEYPLWAVLMLEQWLATHHPR